ncbi:MAG: Tol-Pal system beta propeller repeat protein TolB [Pseudomonadota bacterium]
MVIFKNLKNAGSMCRAFFLCLLFSGLLLAGDAKARLYIDVYSPQARKIQIAVPYFRAEGLGKPALGQEYSEILSSALLFHGVFNVVDPAAYGGSDVYDWRKLGAEFVVKSRFKLTENRLVLNLMLLDVVEGKILLNESYAGNVAEAREHMHGFCDLVVKTLTGEPGISGSKIVFVGTVPNGKEVFIADFDGDNPGMATSDRSIVLSPKISPDGSEIAFTSYREGTPIIYVKHLVTGKIRKLAGFKGTNLSPAWSPDGKSLAVSLSKEGHSQIFLLDRQGQIIRRLTENWGINVSPTWAPDGRQLAFVSDISGGPQIYVLDLQTMKQRRLTFEGKYNTAPEWSPRGDKIVYNSMRDSHFEICTIDVKSGKVDRLTSNSGNNENPSWSPDGRQIVFSSSRDGRPGLFVMFADGSGQRRILKTSGSETQPCWSRRLD